ncbi:rubredoxin [Burkholderia plantarii]|uniref:rubredoxin n=1 Tax=Burkholderia plantarii TaxID=41899 RepID=UPI001F5BC647|nr:rubredoxin [Burkholderia plantarii]
MYKKGTALELQFAPRRLVADGAEPLRIDLTADDVERLYRGLDACLAADRAPGAGPLVVSLDAAPAVAGPAEAGAAAGPAALPEAPAVPPPGDFRQFVCLICGWIYDEASGDVEHGIAPGTRWEQVPDDWRCPLCDVGKEDFVLAEF